MRPLIRIVCVPAVLCIPLAGTGCAFDASADSGTVVRDSAGITIVENDPLREE